jgi:hypothetical protein
MLMICDDESVILSPAEVHALPQIQARGAEVDARGSGAAARGSSQAVMPARPRTGPGGPPVTAGSQGRWARRARPSSSFPSCR